MSLSDDEDECFARFLESEVSSVEDEEKTKEPEPKRQRIEKDKTKVVVDKDVDQKENGHNKDRNGAKRIESGDFTKVPTELFRHIFKFLSSEDLLSCALVCKFLNFTASDESLWRRL
ncbi:BnaA01g27280D [Brassica napus]|uniref:BnaA01g27280D protein n=1 Tax=Brassica napus TaxID=3708 RepID=A0A078HBA7_BRANA|nr:BnaA01g27280D [Brassica napus]